MYDWESPLFLQNYVATVTKQCWMMYGILSCIALNGNKKEMK